MIDSREKPWGLWTTIGFGLIVGAAFFIVQIFLFAAFALAEWTMNLDLGFDAMAENLKVNGLFIALAAFVTTPLCIGLIVLFCRLRKGPSAKRYLGFTSIAPRAMLRWLGAVMLFALTSDVLTRLLGRPLVPDFMADAYATAYCAPFFWVAIVVAAPLLEEVFFRGFLFKGFLHSKLGPIGAVILTSLAWTVLHVQYGVYELSTIFALGIVFGVSRLQSGSIYPSLAMHSLFNLLAMVQLVAFFGSV